MVEQILNYCENIRKKLITHAANIYLNSEKTEQDKKWHYEAVVNMAHIYPALEMGNLCYLIDLLDQLIDKAVSEEIEFTTYLDLNFLTQLRDEVLLYKEQIYP